MITRQEFSKRLYVGSGTVTFEKTEADFILNRLPDTTDYSDPHDPDCPCFGDYTAAGERVYHDRHCSNCTCRRR